MIIPFTLRGWLTTGHGVLFGGGYIVLLVVALGAVTWLRPAELLPAGRESTRRQIGMTLAAAAAVAWITVITGTWGIYPWFRADAAESATSVLRARASLAPWGSWVVLSKAWIAWTSAGLTTLAAAAGFRWRRRLTSEPRLRRCLQGLLTAALVAAAYAGAVGTLLAKLAPVR